MRYAQMRFSAGEICRIFVSLPFLEADDTG